MRILLERHSDNIAIIKLDNQSKMNAITRSMMEDLGRLWDELEADDTRCIIITGAGQRAFCVGADISGDLTASPEKAKTINRSLLKTDTYSKPIIAAINGDCVGGGLELVLASDIRGSVENARFGLPEVKWSIYPFGGGTVKLIQQIGYVHAMDLLLTGRLISSAEAKAIGLVNITLNADKLMDWALDVANTITRNSPSAVQAVKTQVSSTIADHALSRESLDQELGDRVRTHPDFEEGVSAFLEKRKPSY
ncbi:MAG: enoyl-CoA hydratase [Rhodospirillaceae bacterium]|nr:enoyl-CoA hydratase [Rhodospirillaceae bacterium]